MRNTKTLYIIILILAVALIILGINYLNLQNELRATKVLLQSQKESQKILEFTKLFIEKVLKAETEVDFETRLKLENAIRNLGDEEILSQWQKFTESKTEADAQTELKNLLELLINKIK
ncbi:MAG: hypothetical protein AB1643_01630 [Patescibacteria group bacterium]